MIAAIIQESFYSFAKHIVRKFTISPLGILNLLEEMGKDKHNVCETCDGSIIDKGCSGDKKGLFGLFYIKFYEKERIKASTI